MDIPVGARLGTHRKCKPYRIVDFWVKFEESELNSLYLSLAKKSGRLYM